MKLPIATIALSGDPAEKHDAIDVIYTPIETPLISSARAKGARTLRSPLSIA